MTLLVFNLSASGITWLSLHRPCKRTKDKKQTNSTLTGEIARFASGSLRVGFGSCRSFAEEMALLPKLCRTLVEEKGCFVEELSKKYPLLSKNTRRKVGAWWDLSRTCPESVSANSQFIHRQIVECLKRLKN